MGIFGICVTKKGCNHKREMQKMKVQGSVARKQTKVQGKVDSDLTLAGLGIDGRTNRIAAIGGTVSEGLRVAGGTLSNIFGKSKNRHSLNNPINPRIGATQTITNQPNQLGGFNPMLIIAAILGYVLLRK